MPHQEWSLYGPQSFQGYLTEHNLRKHDTAQTISVDHYERLNPALRQADTMVLRLGKSHDGSTQFALVGTPGRLADFFLHDTPAPGPEPYTAEADLTAYSVFPTLTETSQVNLAFASGLIGHALDLDKPYPTAAPATGSSTYTFSFLVHSEYQQRLTHVNGQVEIDAVFVGRRRGNPHLFVLEAKSGTATRTLAKHKLVYAALALAPRVPPEMPIIPVYLRVTGQTYHLTECHLPDPRTQTVALDELTPVRRRSLTLTTTAEKPRANH
jgi:hypothetical protein